MGGIIRTIEEHWEELKKEQKLDSTIFKNLGGKKILDIHTSTMHHVYHSGWGSIPGSEETFYEYKNSWYVVGNEDQLRKYIILLVLTEIDEHFIEPSYRKFFLDSNRDDHYKNGIDHYKNGILDPKVFGIFSLAKNENEKGIVPSEFGLQRNIDLAKTINIYSEILDLDKMNDVFEKTDADEVIKNVKFSKDVIKNYCRELTNLLNDIDNTGMHILKDLIWIRNGIKQFQRDTHGDYVEDYKKYFELSRKEKTHLFNEEYKGYKGKFTSPIKNMILSSKNYEEFSSKVEEYQKLIELPIEEFLYKEMDYNNELLIKNHIFLKEQVLPYFDKKFLGIKSSS